MPLFALGTFHLLRLRSSWEWGASLRPGIPRPRSPAPRRPAYSKRHIENRPLFLEHFSDSDTHEMPHETCGAEVRHFKTQAPAAFRSDHVACCAERQWPVHVHAMYGKAPRSSSSMTGTWQADSDRCNGCGHAQRAAVGVDMFRRLSSSHLRSDRRYTSLVSMAMVARTGWFRTVEPFRRPTFVGTVRDSLLAVRGTCTQHPGICKASESEIPHTRTPSTTQTQRTARRSTGQHRTTAVRTERERSSRPAPSLTRRRPSCTPPRSRGYRGRGPAGAGRRRRH
jgi:hypothetical protein